MNFVQIPMNVYCNIFYGLVLTEMYENELKSKAIPVTSLEGL
jgi:hypothetical protein